METLEELKLHYKLTEEEFEEMYKKCEYITFYDIEPSNDPLGVFVGGQTGAGKGGIDVYSEQELKEKGEKAAILDVDIYRASFPYTTEILAKYPTQYADITAEATGMCLRRIMQKAIDEKYNFIFEGTLKNTEALETMKRMPKDFNKVVRVMATSKIESMLTAFERNYEQIQVSGYGRFTNIETHNKTYLGVLNTIKAIEESGENITIELFKRGENMTSPIKIYNSNDSKEKAYDVLQRERSIDLKQNKESRQKRFENLLKILVPKDEFEKTQLEKLKSEVNSMLQGE